MSSQILLIEKTSGLFLTKDENVISKYKFKNTAESFELYKNNTVSEGIETWLKCLLDFNEVIALRDAEYLKEFKNVTVDTSIRTRNFQIEDSVDKKSERELALKISGVKRSPDISGLFFLFESLLKDINTRSMRIKEWYIMHFSDKHEIAESEDFEGFLVQVLKLDSEDAFHIKSDAQDVLKDMQNKVEIFEMLQQKLMLEYANLFELMGNTQNDVIALCKLICLTNNQMHTYPASALQILGSKKYKSKFGVIYNTSFIQKTKKNPGKISRVLANKIALCARLDYENQGKGGDQILGYGAKWKKEIEEKIENLNKVKQDNRPKKKKISVTDYDRKVYKSKKPKKHSTVEFMPKQ